MTRRTVVNSGAWLVVAWEKLGFVMYKGRGWQRLGLMAAWGCSVFFFFFNLFLRWMEKAVAMGRVLTQSETVLRLVKQVLTHPYPARGF